MIYEIIAKVHNEMGMYQERKEMVEADDMQEAINIAGEYFMKMPCFNGEKPTKISEFFTKEYADKIIRRS
jgi:hypothetical protein